MAKRVTKQGRMLRGADVRTSERRPAGGTTQLFHPRPAVANRRVFLGVQRLDSSRPSQVFSDPAKGLGPSPVHERLLLAFLTPLTRN